MAVGQSDITGDDFGEIFARAIGGRHLNQPVGVTDVVWKGSSWSAKTVKSNNPFSQQSVRLISGRNSPTFSYNITDPLFDVQETGDAVLRIWNERVNQSFNTYEDLRVVVLIRDMRRYRFTLFEFEAARYVPGDYEWRLNNRNNLEGYDRSSGVHRFTWQPHGSQFTVIRQVPPSACKFRITEVSYIDPEDVLTLIGFNEKWIERVT